MSRNLAKGRPRPHLQNQSENPEDWLIRDEEDHSWKTLLKNLRNGCEGWTICVNYSSVFNIIMQILSVIFV